MSSTKLKEDLCNCLINFDRRVLITQLLDDYKCDHEEVNKIIENYLVEQQKDKKTKFEKRYLIHGYEKNDEVKTEIYKIVEEKKLSEWLQKLKNAESSLYSVEVAGGAKAAAPVFKPMSLEECVKSTRRQETKLVTTNGKDESSTTTSSNKLEVKQETKLDNVKKESPKELHKSKTTTENLFKKTSSKTETSPTDKKATDKKSVAKKGINNFFAPSTSAASKKSEDLKPKAESVAKPTTPKKMQDFFKKQTEKPKTNTESIKKPAVNTSIQLFDEDEPEEIEEEVSSDEEEKLAALKRDIISSDVEMEEETENNKPTTSSKRRRILDSEDEEDPPVKQEKIDIEEETKEDGEPVEETYLDEQGFVVTKKPKQKTKTKKSPATVKAPAVTIKNSPKETKKSNTILNKDGKAATNPAAKTKQAGIMNFFSKK